MLKFQTLLPAWDKEVRVLEFGKMEIPFSVSIVVSFGQISRRDRSSDCINQNRFTELTLISFR